MLSNGLIDNSKIETRKLLFINIIGLPFLPLCPVPPPPQNIYIKDTDIPLFQALRKQHGQL